MLAESKLNSIETLISQTLIVMDISHEEFIAILKEKDRYEMTKDNLMLVITVDNCNKCNLEINIDPNNSQYFWINLKRFRN